MSPLAEYIGAFTEAILAKDNEAVLTVRANDFAVSVEVKRCYSGRSLYYRQMVTFVELRSAGYSPAWRAAHDARNALESIQRARLDLCGEE